MEEEEENSSPLQKVVVAVDPISSVVWLLYCVQSTFD